MKIKVEMYDEEVLPLTTTIRRETNMNTESVIVEDELKTENRREPKERKLRGFALWGARIKTALVVMMAVFAAILVGLRLTGFRSFTVMSGSMAKSYPVGSLIYVSPVNYQDLQIGDVISYVANDEGTVVTHRIVDIEIDEEGTYRFRTKGDENNTADSKLVHYKNILGTPVITIPYIGYIAYNIQQPPGIYITLVAGTLLLAWTFLPSTLEERRKTARKNVIIN